MYNKSIIIGSYYFFNKFKDYKVHDIDKLVVCNNLPVSTLNLRRNNEDIFFIKKCSKEKLFSEHLVKENPLKAGKFLIPEFCNQFNITLKDLKQYVKPILLYVDNKHNYQKLILDYYFANNEMKLTREQLNDVFIDYKLNRYSLYYDAYKVGSWAFYEQFDDYKIHDYDYVIFEHNSYKHVYIKDTKEDLHVIPSDNKLELIKIFKSFNGKYQALISVFLFPEIIQKLNVTIDDLKEIKQQMELLKNDRPYLYAIYEFYLKNNEMKLTDEQLKISYQLYKQYKNK